MFIISVYAIGEQSFYDCESGHALSGPNSRTCIRGGGGHGTWTGYYDVQHCKRKKLKKIHMSIIKEEQVFVWHDISIHFAVRHIFMYT